MKPILFNSDMVRAILDNRKQQTRRKVKLVGPPDSEPIPEHAWVDRSYEKPEHGNVPCLKVPFSDETLQRHFPPWQVGDRLWVRETWCNGNGLNLLLPDGRTGPKAPDVIYAADETYRLPTGTKWRPSIFMPRWASRITLEITAIRVERLQEITAEDARSEGIQIPRCGCDVCSMSAAICTADQGEYIQAFMRL